MIAIRAAIWAICFSTIDLILAQQQRLSVAVYYESLCPDSRDFINRQLYPNFSVLSPYLKLDLVPYGKATTTNTSGELSFTCQHGPKECYGNMIQSCVVSATTQYLGLHFVNCIMGSVDSSNDKFIRFCAQLFHVPWRLIEDCRDFDFGTRVLAENGVKTEPIVPITNYVPTIVFNGNYSAELQAQAESNFLETVCKLIDNGPVICGDFK